MRLGLSVLSSSSSGGSLIDPCLPTRRSSGRDRFAATPLSLSVMRLDSNRQRSAPVGSATHLPEHVQRVITELVADSSVHKIWLVGSQVNGTASLISDWDLLVFSNREPSVREERCPDVDVIWKGPTQTQREGGSIQIDFTKFQWIENDDGTADYVGCKFIEFEYGVARDASISPMLQSPQRAVCIWAALKNDDVPDNNA